MKLGEREKDGFWKSGASKALRGRQLLLWLKFAESDGCAQSHCRVYTSHKD